MKVILSCALVVLFGFIGYGISASYIKRKRFYFNLLNFLTNLQTQINFSQEKMDLIIQNYCLNSINGELCNILNNYLKNINKTKIDKNELFKNVFILSEQEKDSIYLFFLNLGKRDVFSEIEEIQKFEKFITDYYIKSKDEAEKYSRVYTKLGIIFGAFLAIIII